MVLVVRRRWFFGLFFVFIAVGIVVFYGWRNEPAIEVKSASSYWQEIQLNMSLESSLLADSNCYSNEKIFLGCINAVESVSSLFRLVPSTSGRFKPMVQRDYERIKSEKERLKNWSDYFRDHRQNRQRVSISKSWSVLKEKLFSIRYSSYLTGVAINAYLSIVKDPHTYVAPKKWFLERVATAKQSTNFLGFSIERSEKGFVVAKSDQKGLERGDLVLRVNGKEIKSLFLFELQDLIVNQHESKLKLSVLRENENLDVLIYPKNMEIFSVEGRLSQKTKDVGYIKIRRFSEKTCQDVQRLIEEFRSQTSLRGLVLDLRNNPGGIISEAGCVSGLFLGPDKIIYTLKSINEKNQVGQVVEETYLTQNRNHFEGSLMVLVNSDTASAAEILAGALQDYGRARIVGTTTFGKGSYQVGQVWENHSDVLYFKTAGLYYLPSGRTPQLVGVQPDVLLAFQKAMGSQKNGETTTGERQYWSSIIDENGHPGFRSQSPLELGLEQIREVNSWNAKAQREIIKSIMDASVHKSCSKNIKFEEEQNIEGQAEVATGLYQCLQGSRLEGGIL